MGDAHLVFLTSLLLIAAGYVSRVTGILREEHGKALSAVILNLTFPALIITTVLSLRMRPMLLFLPLIAVLFSSLSLMIGFFVFRGRPGPERGVLLMGVNGFNIGMFAFPIVEGLWGREGLTYFAMFDMGNAVVLLGINYLIGSLFSPNRSGVKLKMNAPFVLKSLAKSVPFMTYLAAVAANLLGLGIPSFLQGSIGALSRANMALVLLLLGLYLDFRFEKGRFSALALSFLIRYGLGLAVGLSLFFFLPFEPMFRGLVLIALILPVGLSVIPFSVEFGLDTRLAAMLANFTVLISFALMWLLITVFSLH